MYVDCGNLMGDIRKLQRAHIMACTKGCMAFDPKFYPFPTETSTHRVLPGNHKAVATITVKTEPQEEQVVVPPTLTQPGVSPTLLDCAVFEAIGLQQPFTVSISSNVLMLMDFHSHLCTSEVAGYLAGTYNTSTKGMAFEEEGERERWSV